MKQLYIWVYTCTLAQALVGQGSFNLSGAHLTHCWYSRISSIRDKNDCSASAVNWVLKAAHLQWNKQTRAAPHIRQHPRQNPKIENVHVKSWGEVKSSDALIFFQDLSEYTRATSPAVGFDSPLLLPRGKSGWCIFSSLSGIYQIIELILLLCCCWSRAMLALVTADILIKDSLNIIVLSVVLILTLAGYLFTQRKDSSTVRFQIFHTTIMVSFIIEMLYANIFQKPSVLSDVSAGLKLEEQGTSAKSNDSTDKVIIK
jgi:hypothetical protein